MMTKNLYGDAFDRFIETVPLNLSHQQIEL